jgi:hypothetical protein
MLIPTSALLLSGFVLAHAAWSVSDLPKGELLCPLAIIEQDGQRKMLRYEAGTQAEAIAHGKAAMIEATKTVNAWAFAHEGLLPENEGKTDVIVVEFWSKGMSNPMIIFQRFEPFAKQGKFHLIGDPILVIDGIAQKSDTKDTIKTIREGVSTHPKVAILWDGWH